MLGRYAILANMPRPIRAVVKASALRHNLKLAREAAGEAKIWAVLKANAYGHGLERAARALADADGYAVLDFQEAVRLRLAGVKKPILMLEGFFKPLDVNLLFKYDLTPVIHNADQVEVLQKTTLEAPIDAYLKVNSGMNRLGFGGPAAADVQHAAPAPQDPRDHADDALPRGRRGRTTSCAGSTSWCSLRGAAPIANWRRCCASRRRARAGRGPASCSTAVRRSPTGARRKSVSGRR
jgi:hypothetical protein